MNPSWDFDQVIESSRCLCFKSSYTMKVMTSLNKSLFYPDEQIIVNFVVDNSRSERDIKEIRCTVKHKVQIMKAEEQLQSINYNLSMQEVKGVKKNRVQEK